MSEPSSVAEVFRAEWSRVVATLMRDFGDLELAEDATQDAFTAAAERWTDAQRPDQPGAWLVTTARNSAIDRLRRERRFDDRAAELQRRSNARDEDAAAGVRGLVDDQLALVLGCCHPALAPDAQVALTLRVVAGLSTAQIARSFLVSEATMTRRITRAKSKIRSANIPFELDRDRLVDRLIAVRAVIYSIFTEGHTSATDAAIVRGDLCDEATWLAGLLGDLVPDDPEVTGLHALLLFSDARRAARLAPDGSLVLLPDQDRAQWDQQKIAAGLALLAKAFSAHSAGSYQLQAAIAALHSTATTFEATPWPRIVALYDVLVIESPGPVTALNRAVAVGHAHGPQVGLDALDALDVDALVAYPYFHSARGEFLHRLGDPHGAVAAFEHAAACPMSDSERQHVRRRIEEVTVADEQ